MRRKRKFSSEEQPLAGQVRKNTNEPIDFFSCRVEVHRCACGTVYSQALEQRQRSKISGTKCDPFRVRLFDNLLRCDAVDYKAEYGNSIARCLRSEYSQPGHTSKFFKSVATQFLLMCENLVAADRVDESDCRSESNGARDVRCSSPELERACRIVGGFEPNFMRHVAACL